MVTASRVERSLATLATSVREEEEEEGAWGSPAAAVPKGWVGFKALLAAVVAAVVVLGVTVD